MKVHELSRRLNEREREEISFAQVNHMILPIFCRVWQLLSLLLVFYAWSLNARKGGTGDNDESCKKYNFHQKPIEILPNNTYGLWPGLASKADLESGEELPGFYEVSVELLLLCVVHVLD